jgi:hypothetical protein
LAVQAFPVKVTLAVMVMELAAARVVARGALEAVTVEAEVALAVWACHHLLQARQLHTQRVVDMAQIQLKPGRQIAGMVVMVGQVGIMPLVAVPVFS